MPIGDSLSEISRNLSAVRARIDAAALRAGRDPAAVRLAAVSKGQPVEAILEAAAAGQRLFGENYVEEAAQKIESAGAGVEWHMLGHVQSRKAERVAGLFAAVQSVDSLALAGRLARFAQARGAELGIFLECNVSGEASKSGFAASDRASWPALVDSWRELAALPGLRPAGLMTMAPYGAEEEAIRRVFRALRELRDAARHAMPDAGWDGLSMGMSDDFETAIEEGATLVRVGRAVFGARNPR